MAFQKVSGARNYFKYNECTPGQVLIDSGAYIGEEEGTYGIQHIFDLPNGDQAVLNSAGKLNFLLSKNKAIGKTCRIIYVGKLKVPKGKMAGKEFHEFELLIDNDVPVVETPAANAPGVATAEGDLPF